MSVLVDPGASPAQVRPAPQSPSRLMALNAMRDRHNPAMGASGWSYVAPYNIDIATSTRHLQERPLREGEFYWYWDAGYPNVEFRPRPSSVEELRNSEDFRESGSATILDIMRAADTPDAPDWRNPDDFSTIRPLAPDRSWHYFGTGHPSRAQFESLANDPDNPHHRDFQNEDYMRWTGHYVLFYEGEVPTWL